MGSMESRKKVTGVEVNLDVARITVLGVPNRPGIAATLFAALAEEGINVDAIVQGVSIEGTADVSFTVRPADRERAAAVIVGRVLYTVGAMGLHCEDGLAKVSIVGAGMLNTPGYAARMFRALADEGINIKMITTSEIRIACIVQLADAERAQQALRRAFELEVP